MARTILARPSGVKTGGASRMRYGSRMPTPGLRGGAPTETEKNRAPVVAALGPTNTGKTHRAIERMLEHESGMIGLPLRLLAREVYDRVSARVGEERVALVTGEEKRVPARPAYWVCTVEAMPVDRAVDFVAVDEIQLAAHRERGHVFTDRLLHARGRKETWLLGAETMRPMIDAFIPSASHERYRRFSSLRFTGSRSLRSLPPRSAVVAFSTDQVYELAERLRRLRGGVAVVLGALSPRTRNAQVAMYQAGEVHYLVATDAIGMGLNLDVDHVAFGALRKFDGQKTRALALDEIAQIAGRAGRHVNDGSFGTLRSAPEIPPDVASRIERHRFDPIARLVWRASDLEWSSLDALLDSLRAPPFHPALGRVDHADDQDALAELAKMDEVRAVTTDEASVRLLFEVCQIPDFRKLLLFRHVALLKEIYLGLRAGDGRLDDAWLDAQIRRVDDVTGGIDALTARLAAVRVWTYVSHRDRWLRDPEAVQARTRAIEDALGDALHERLVERFVTRGGAPVRRRARSSPAASASAPTGDAKTATGPFAKLAAVQAELLGIADAGDEATFVSRLADAAHDELSLDRFGRIVFEGERIGRLTAGRDAGSPQIALEEPEAWGAGDRARVERRLRAFARDVVSRASGGLADAPARRTRASAEARSLAYVLGAGLGIARLSPVRAKWAALDEAERQSFVHEGVHAGARYLFADGALDPDALEHRAILVALGDGRPPPEPIPGAPVLPRSILGDPDRAQAFGYEAVGKVAVRVDVIERLASLVVTSRDDAAAFLDALGLGRDGRTGVLSAIGYRDDSERGLVRARRRRRRRRGPGPRGGRSNHSTGS